MSKISELSDGGSLTSTDQLIVVRAGGNLRVKMDTINVDQVDLGDNEMIRLGNSQDLTMVHTSTQSIINQAGIGDLLLQKAGTTKASITANGLEFPDNSKAIFGAGSDLQIYHSATHSYIQDSGTGSLRLVGADIEFLNADFSDFFAKFANNGASTFYYDGSAKIATTATGIDVTGNAELSANSSLILNATSTSDTNRINWDYDGTTYAHIGRENSTGDMQFTVQSSERMRIDANGNVGIGTSSDLFDVLTVDDTNPKISMRDSGTERAFFEVDSSDNFVINNKSASAMILETSDTERMRIDASGNLLVGRTSTSGLGKLNVEGGADFTGGDVYLSRDSGSVGIGTGSPAQKLSVSGASGSARFSLERSNTNTTGGIGSIQWNALDGHAVAGIVALGDGNDEGAHIAFNTTSAASSSDVYVSTTERMRIDSSGRVTKPYQPAFYATPSSAQTGLLANDSAVTVAMGTEIFDVGSNFASSAFTAPVTGKYQLNLSLYMTTVDTGASYVLVGIVTSNRNYINIVAPKYASDPAYLTQNISTLADMDAGDTAYVYYQQSGGAAQTAVQNDTRGSFFQGYLVA